MKVTHREEVQHEVSINVDVALEGTLSLDVIEWLKAEVRLEVQKKNGTVKRESKGSEQELTLDGNVATRYKVSWYDRIQKGTVKFRLDSGDAKELPFEVKEGELVKATPLTGTDSPGQ